MPRPNEFVTSANQNYSLYITREETIQAISSIVPLLSTFSTITFGVSPNPKFSTIAMNPTGQISGFVPIQTSNVIFASTTNVGAAGGLRLGNVGQTSNAAVISVDQNGNAAPIRASAFLANLSGAGGYSAGWGFTNQGFTTFDGQNAQTPVLTWQFGNNARIALSNISSINGAPVNANPTTYTNLSGNNITNSQVIGTPSIVNLSSLNGLAMSNYLNQQPWVPYTVTNITPVSQALTANIQTSVLGFTAIPIVAPFGNKAINISVPITITPTGTLASPLNVMIQAFVGGQATGGSGVQQQVSFAAGQGTGNGRTITLSGTCICNGNQASLAIYAIADQNITLSFVQGSGSFNRFFFQQII